jgi:hypothetical protein
VQGLNATPCAALPAWTAPSRDGGVVRQHSHGRHSPLPALGIFLLILQTLVFLAISGGLVLAAGGAAISSTQKRRPVAG